MADIREISTVTRDACKLVYVYRQRDSMVTSVCVIDVSGRMVTPKNTDWEDALWHLENCVKNNAAFS